jgi:dihydrolipoamide dehydrogenase
MNDYKVIIIGGGPAGHSAAEAAGKAGLKTILFEKSNIGGVCLNEGCVPTKTLLYSAKTYDNANHALKYGVTAENVGFDAAKIVARKNKVVRKLVLGVKGKMTSAGVTVVNGEATIVDAHTVSCGEERYTADNLIVCAGSDTFVPPIPGTDSVNYWTHRDALDAKELPASLVIVGGGVIGMEFASYFCSLGTKVTVIEMLGEILGGMDGELSALLRAEYAKRGIKFLINTRVTAIAQGEEGISVSFENADGASSVTAEKLLMSVGRRPVVSGYGLENLPLQRDERGRLIVDGKMRSGLDNVYICGDLNGRSMLAHTAVREAEVAVNNILGRDDEMSYRAIPGVVYTNPEIAGVGQTEENLKSSGTEYVVHKLPMAFSGRFVAENEGVNGVCKMLLSPDGTVLGVHLLGNPASEIIALAGMAVEMKMNVEEWKRYVMPHPTVCEILREAL